MKYTLRKIFFLKSLLLYLGLNFVEINNILYNKFGKVSKTIRSFLWFINFYVTSDIQNYIPILLSNNTKFK